jgi:Sulfotransferase domain
MGRLPSFVIIGAMKSATSTLYEQLCRQPGIFLPDPKEPNFFSNDEQYARGIDWYTDLFEPAAPSDILGEASTHYTKLPTYPKTVERMRAYLAAPRLIYVMRDPMRRLVSQYVHQWTEGEIRCDLDSAIDRHPELIAYSSYVEQLTPFIEVFGRHAILPIFFDRLLTNPDGELKRVCHFIGYTGKVEWKQDLSHRNVSADRVRHFPLFDVLIDNRVAEKLRRGLVPKSIRTRVRRLVSITEPPKPSAAVQKRLEEIFDKELAILGRWLGATLNCRNFRSMTSSTPLDWH